MKAFGSFLRRILDTGTRRPGVVRAVAMGRTREFSAYDVGADTFVVEKGVASRLRERPSVLIAAKSDLRRGGRGWVMTLTTGNHAVAAFPLLDGRFWGLSNLPSARRSETLARRILCANVVRGTVEISQREVSTPLLVEGDRWLRETVGFALDDIVMAERNDETLDYFRRLGQEWRVKPLAWTEEEVRAALTASRKRISTTLGYYHSAKGVHFLTYAEFASFCELARTDPEEFVRGLRELVSVYEGNRRSFVRMPKHRGHHEIEFFGIRRGLARDRLIPELEGLLEAIERGRAGQLGVIQRAQEIVQLFRSLLTQPEFAGEESPVFAEALYMYITGEIYSVVGEGSTPAFDDRRTALPGATFTNGRADLHPGADERTRVLLSNIRGLMSKDEILEYANVYELRNDRGHAPIGRGCTREIVYKTNRGPLERSLIEKRLSRASRGYGSYMLARVQAFKSLGVALSEYLLLRRRSPSSGRPFDYYIRRRCEGEPMDAIPANYFRPADGSAAESKDVVLALAGLMGDAAAQNMAMKKFDPRTESPLFGVGKEIYEFEFDITARRIVPKRVSTCSVRGSFGWPVLAYDEANFTAIADFYMGGYARALRDFHGRHRVSMREVASRFMEGFEHRTRVIGWQLSVMRDKFEEFHPDLPRAYAFDRKWRFVMWSLERQERRLPFLRKVFFAKVRMADKEEG